MLDQAVEATMKGYIDEITGEDDVENAVVGKVTLVNEARKYLMEQNGQEPVSYTHLPRRALSMQMP